MFRMAMIVAALGFAFTQPASAAPKSNPLQDGETWESLRHDVFGDRPIADGGGWLTVEAPYRAEDAAIVPVTIRQDADAPHRVTALHLIVDENPAPVAATFTFGPAMPTLDFHTRVRVDQYSNVRAIAETEAGELFMAGRFVKASGGCSAPSLKDAEAAMAHIGKLKVRYFPTSDAKPKRSGELREAQVMMRHPNYSGLQMNQVTQLFIPAHFVDALEVHQGDELVFRMEAGISISEDPVFRFHYRDNGAEAFTVKASDTDGEVYEGSFAKSGS